MTKCAQKKTKYMRESLELVKGQILLKLTQEKNCVCRISKGMVIQSRIKNSRDDPSFERAYWSYYGKFLENIIFHIEILNLKIS